MPSGFATIRDSPPGAGSAISLGCTTNPASASVVARSTSTANGRQRGGGSGPDGNSSSRKTSAAYRTAAGATAKLEIVSEVVSGPDARTVSTAPASESTATANHATAVAR